jgi:hypothetical protein
MLFYPQPAEATSFLHSAKEFVTCYILEILNPLITTALGPTQPPIQWVPGSPSLGVKRPGREADQSPPSSAEIRECVELYLHSPIRLHGVVLI